MQTVDRQSVRNEMISELLDFIQVLLRWIDYDGNDGMRMIDPYETHYSENYAPANAAVICAGVYRSTLEPRHLELCLAMVRRSVKLLEQKKTVSPFCRVFLFHYSLMALLLLPDRQREECAAEFAGFYSRYEDDCQQLNTNCAALQWGMELFLEALGFRTADKDKLETLLQIVEKAQSQSGFINDECTFRGELDGMPIAYHVFTLFILAGSVAVAGSVLNDSDRVGSIVSKGLFWLQHAITNDGSFAMIERSRYQMFTWGAFVALLSGSNLCDSPLYLQAWRYWLSFEQDDGSFSCVPNHWPHALRVGFESYTHVNMYNNLGLTGIVIAIKLLEDGGETRTRASEMHVPAENRFLDESSGYAFFRKEGRFFGCTLRMHNRKYAPALQGFHFRLKDVRLPLAEPNFYGTQSSTKHLADGVWEGFLLESAAGEACFCNATENAFCEFLDNGVRLVLDADEFHCIKEIHALSDGFCWSYRLTLKRTFAGLKHVLPILMHDGRRETTVTEKSSQQVNIRYDGREFALTCDTARSIGLLLTRSLLSVSGVSAPAHVAVHGPLESGKTFVWETRLRFIGP